MNKGRSSAVHIFRLSLGTFGWIAVAVQLAATLTLPTGPDALRRITDYFSFFTILSNMLTAAALTVPELAHRSLVARFLRRYSTRTAIAVYMMITSGVYVTLLAGLSQLTEVQYLADVALHYVIPPLYLLDWLLIRPDHRPAWKCVFYFLIFPLLYGIYTLARGAVINSYPYPFVDVTKLGYPTVLINIGRFVILFACVSACLIAIARWRARRSGLDARSRGEMAECSH